VRPAYALVEKLERDDWPVRVRSDLAPRWFAPPAYNTMVAGFAVAIAAAWLGFGALLASGLTLSVVPSDSMTPTVQRRDVLLVDKVSPRLGWRPAPDQLVLFHPPARLQQIVASRQAAAAAAGASTSALVDPNALFLKRVAARGGDAAPPEVTIAADGMTRIDGVVVRRAVDVSGPIAPLVAPMEGVALARDEYVVLGDNEAGSIDSRCWGTLSQADLAGRPLLRVLPPARFGAIR